MRIVHVIASSRGGGAVHLRRVAAAQAAAGHRVVTVMPEDGQLSGRSLQALGIVHRNPGRLGPERLGWLADLLAAEDVDVLHCHGARAALWARLACLARASRRPRVVYSLHGFTAPYRPFFTRQAMRLAERLLDPLTDAYVVGSEAEGADARTFGLDGRRMQVIYNGLDAARFAGGDGPAARTALGLPRSAFVMITVCRLDQPRDPGLFVRVLAQLADETPPPRLVVVGEGPLRAAAEALAVELGVRHWVSFLGYRDDLERLLASADVFLHATTGWEGGVPLALLEGMAAGLPVVATAAGGIPEGVVEGETGHLVAVGDADAMADAARRLRDDPHRAAGMGRAGQQRARERFPLAALERGYARLYEGLGPV